MRLGCAKFITCFWSYQFLKIDQVTRLGFFLLQIFDVVYYGIIRKRCLQDMKNLSTDIKYCKLLYGDYTIHSAKK